MTSSGTENDPQMHKDPTFGSPAPGGHAERFGFSSLRGVRWRIGLGILPSPGSSIPEFRRAAADSRRSYATLRRHLLVDPHLKDGNKSNDLSMDNPLSQNPDSSWVRFFQNAELEKLVHQDLLRLYPEQGSYFQTPACQVMLRRILLLWCVKHPECGYRQGMHEVLAPLLYALYVDLQSLLELQNRCAEHFVDDTYGLLERNSSLNNRNQKKEVSVDREDVQHDFQGNIKTDSGLGNLDPDTWNTVLSSEPYGAEGELGAVLSKRFMEHDAYCMFDSLMAGAHGVVSMAEFFSANAGSNPSSSPVMEGSAALYYVLSSVDPSLHDHLVGLGVEPQYFAIRWLRVLFVREFSLENLMVIWDEIFSASNYGWSLHIGRNTSHPSFRLLSSPCGIFISAMAVSMLLYLRSSLLATGNATSCLQKLLSFPENIHVRQLIEKAKSLQCLVPNGSSLSLSWPDHPLNVDKKSKLSTHKEADNYWEEKWQVLNREDVLQKDTKRNPLPGAAEKFRRERLSLSGLEFITSPSRNGAGGEDPQSLIRRRSLDDLTQEADSQGYLKDTVHREVSLDSKASLWTPNHDSYSEKILPSNSGSGNCNEDATSMQPSSSTGLLVESLSGNAVITADAGAKYPLVSKSAGKPPSAADKRTMSGKFPWIWKFGRSTNGRNSPKGGSFDLRKLPSFMHFQKDHLGFPAQEECSSVVNSGHEGSKTKINLKSLGKSIAENVEVIEEFIKQDLDQSGSSENNSRDRIGSDGHPTALVALKELRRIGELLTDI